MKILLVAPHYPPRFIGGVELATRRLAQRLHAAGHATSVVAVEQLGVAPSDQPEPLQVEQTDDEGVRVWRLSLRAVEGQQAFASTYRPREVESWLVDWLTREQPSVIHLHSGYLLGGAVLHAAARLSIPVVVTLHDFWFICPRITLLHPNQACCSGPETPVKCAWCLSTEQRRYRLPERVMGPRAALHMAQWMAAPPLGGLSPLRARTEAIATRHHSLIDALHGAAAVLSPSRFLRDQMMQAGVDGRRITLLPYGVERRRRLRPRMPDDVAVRVGFLGQIAPHKGIHVLVRAIRTLADRKIELVIHGDLTREPAYVRELKTLAANDPRIVFAGPLPQTELETLFGRIDLLAVPSVWYENSPFVIHEARCAGLPVLASRLGGMAELVQDGEDGLLAEAGSVEAFARAIDRLIAEPSLLGRLRQGVVPPPTIEDETQALIDLYVRVAHQQEALCDS
jgi:glycosyltransferase involved in cell wall biosynthesis